jgi:U3 small nucleolar RNA-associated protein 12
MTPGRWVPCSTCKAYLRVSAQISKIIHPIANLPLGSTHRVTQIQFHPTQPFLALQSHDRSVEVFRIRTEEELKKKMARRKKRAKEKKEKEGGSKMSESMDVDEESNGISFIEKFTPHVVIRATGKIRSFDFSSEASNAKAAAQVGFDHSLQRAAG